MFNEWYQHISFAYPYLLWALTLLPVLIVWYVLKNKQSSSSVTVSSLSIHRSKGSPRNSLRHLPFIIRLIVIALLLIALARPQSRSNEERIEGEGIDIVLCIDVSGTMSGTDFAPTRLEAAKQVAVEFVNERKTDRIGLVIFGGESFTQCPLTNDYAMLISQIKAVNNVNGILDPDKTAIGSGLATSVERLKRVKTKSKVIILLTDGENNAGLIDPNTAKELAKYYKIKVYTIGVSPFSNGHAINENMLKSIASETGALYFRATDNESLSSIYSQIDKLEKTKVETSSFARYSEQFYPFAIAAIVLLLVEVWLRYKVLKKFP